MQESQQPSREEISARNVYRTRILDRLDGQQEKGWDKYSVVLAETVNMPVHERLEHLSQELTDGLMYVEHIGAAVRLIEASAGISILELAAGIRSGGISIMNNRRGEA